MAGAGYNAWTTGDLVSAIQFQNYIQDQTVMVFADASARDTALSSPAEGMICYLKSIDKMQYYNGSTWKLVGMNNALTWATDMTGDADYPYNQDVTTDVTISADTTWTEADYKGRMVCLDVLTINSGKVLTLQGGPWWIFVDTLAGTGTISGNGTAGTSPATTFSADYARGGNRVDGSANAQGGCGGVMVFIVAREVTGAVTITANGGAGARNTTNGSSNEGSGGQGAFSQLFNNAATQAEDWGGGRTGTTGYHAPPSRFAMTLGNGSGMGGGSGAGGTNGGGGGSGIGGAGSVTSAGVGTAGSLPKIDQPSPLTLVNMGLDGCLGGGGGGANCNTTGTNNGASGGGGGSVCVWAQTLTATPTLTANGGSGVGPSGTATGAAGVTYLIDVP